MHDDHSHAPEYRIDRGWTVCVTPDLCAAHPLRQDAHGGIVRTETCTCGAVRMSEHNGGRGNYGEWREPDGGHDAA
jgi:hypothetical protein